MPTKPNSDDGIILSEKFLNGLRYFIADKISENGPRHITAAMNITNFEIKKVSGGYTFGLGYLMKPYKGLSGVGDDARAQEFGSGIHSTRKFKSKHQTSFNSKIKIEPKNKDGLLVFHWEKLKKNGKPTDRFQKRINRARDTNLYSAREMRAEIAAEQEAIQKDWYAKWWKRKVEGTAKGKRILPFEQWANVNRGFDRSGKYIGSMASNLATASYSISRKKEYRPIDPTLFVARSVMHPGIEPYKGRGYIRYTFKKYKGEIAQKILDEAGKNLRIKVRAIFTRPGGKNK